LGRVEARIEGRYVGGESLRSSAAVWAFVPVNAGRSIGRGSAQWKLHTESLYAKGFADGEMAERSNAAVLKTADGDEPSVGSNPTLSSAKAL